MNKSLRRPTPGSNWISAMLLTMFVISFAIFAESRIDSGKEMAETCTPGAPRENRPLVWFH